MIHVLEVSMRDPVIARDGRPFGATQGHRMKSVDWLYPSVTAGMVRTLLGRKHGGKFGPEEVRLLKRIQVAGPLPLATSELFFAAPLDCAVQEIKESKQRTVWASRPQSLQKDEGTDLPNYLRPVMLPPEAEDFKPAGIPPFWSATRMVKWLSNASGTGFTPLPDPREDSAKGLLELGYLKIEKDERFHVNIEPGTYAARESQLFMTVAVTTPAEVGISLRVETGPEFDSYLSDLDEWASLGGERRMVCISSAEGKECWSCPAPVREALAKTNLVRMVLATPALFKDGWKPGWIRDDSQGEFGGLKLQLVGGCIGRWKPISGWSYEQPSGPKPGLRLTPAGSVYFFQVKGDASLLAAQWLQPVSDFGEDGQPQRDGFGLALWGAWEPHAT